MPFRIPQALIAGGGSTTRIFSTDTLIGNLWAYLGSPPSARDVTITADGADLGDVQITLDWAPGSTFTFICINGGRILGLGGGGGDGGSDLGATGQPGSDGQPGGAAISSSFDVSLDVDDGYLLGGGGGGGGGAYFDNGSSGDAGAGGGGGQGFSATAGGSAGSQIGVPPPTDGTGGSQAGPGVGGDGGGTGGDGGDGGDGGIWGAGGSTGESTNLTGIAGFSFQLYGGLGGRGGKAFGSNNAAEISFDGSKNEATLRSEGRIKGETGLYTINVPDRIAADVSVAGSSTHGFSFQRDGDMYRINSSAGNTELPEFWATAGAPSDFGDDYEIRQRGNSGDTDGTFDSTPGAEGTWFALSSTRTYTITSAAGIEGAATLLEVRRSDIPAGSSDDEVIDSFYIRVRDENGS